MPSMSDVLAGIPGYGGYIAKRAMNEQQDMDQLRQFGAMQQIYNQAQEAQKTRVALEREAAFKADLQALGPNPTQEQVAQVALKHAGPVEAIKNVQSSLDRQAQIKATSEAAQARIEAQAQNAAMLHELRLQGAKTADERAAEIARHNRTIEGIQAQLAQIRGTAQNQPKPPAGYRYKADGSGEQEPIPGGPVDVKLRGQSAAAKRSVDLTTQNIDELDKAIADLDADPGLTRITGPLAGRTGNITGAATGAQAKLDTIKNQVFVSTLQAMREASKTGGAVGNVSDKEGERLENSLAALNQAQTTEDFRNQLKIVRRRLQNSKAAIQRAYSEQFPGAGESAAPAAPTQPASPQPQQPANSGGWSITPVR